MDIFLFLFFFVYYVPGLLASPIIGGFIDETHLYKHHVSFHGIIDQQIVPKYFCGGTIIHERYILTAAHPFKTKEHSLFEMDSLRGIKVIAGTNKRNGPGIERNVIRVLIPTAFDGDVAYGDVAVAQLNANLVAEHSNVMQIMRTFPLSSNQGADAPARFCGFGRDTLVRETNGILRPKYSISDTNKVLDVIMLPRAQCPEHDEMICAKSLNRVGIHTSCLGDSGSGLIYDNHVVGVLSQGTDDCNDNKIPMVFTRLSLHSGFIRRALDERGSHADMHVFELQPKKVLLPPARVRVSSGRSRANNPHTQHSNLPRNPYHRP